MRKILLRITPALFLIAVSILVPGIPGPVEAAAGQGKDQTVPFFSQGQAAYNPQDQAKSQQAAIQDFMGQALIQAIGKFLSPSQMGTLFSDIQKKILSQPSKYVDSYQVFSETQNGGLYRVIGQVTIAMDLLRKDMEAQGFSIESAASAKAASPAATSSLPEGDTAAESAVPAKAAQTGESSAAAVTGNPGASAARGLTVTKKEILWVVPEKWEQEWVLPTDKRDTRHLLTQGIARELGDYDYTLQFPPPGSLKMDLTGNIPLSQVIALAQAQGIRAAVLGTASFKQDRGSKMAKLEADLRVIRIGPGPDKSETEIRQEQSMEELSNQEGAAELASRIAPQLNDLLGGPGENETKRSAAGPALEQEGSPASGAGGVRRNGRSTFLPFSSHTGVRWKGFSGNNSGICR